jgi:uncharacterized repeat protein (TIGR02543 family)
MNRAPTFQTSLDSSGRDGRMKKVLVVLVAVLALVGCGGNDNPVSGNGNNGSNDNQPGGGGGGGGNNVTYMLTTSVTPAGSGTVTRSPNQTSYSAGTWVSVTATAANGYTFTGWSGSSVSSNQSVSVIMDRDLTLIANFQRQAANAVIITLTNWETTATDAGGLDPRIHFVVSAIQNGNRVSLNTTGYLLDRQDITNRWTGNVSSSPISFAMQADELQITAVVVEKDLLANDDISPGYSTIFTLPVYSGSSGSKVLDYGSGKSRVTYSYEFIRQ